MQWYSRLRHCNTSQEVVGSVPDGVTGIFHWHNPSSHTVVLGLTHPLTEMSTRNISWGVKVHRTDNLTTFMCRLSWNLGASISWNPQGLSRPVYLYVNWSFSSFCHCDESSEVTCCTDRRYTLLFHQQCFFVIISYRDKQHSFCFK